MSLSRSSGPLVARPRAPVPRLFTFCGPATILRLVVAAVVDAIDRVAGRWTPAHVGNEVLVVEPAVAYGNTAPAIVGIPLVSRVGAALQHATPRAIFGRPCPVVPARVAVASVRRSGAICPVAPAAYRVSRSQVTPGNNRLCAAVASAREACPLHRVGSGHDKKPSESLARQVPENHLAYFTPGGRLVAVA